MCEYLPFKLGPRSSGDNGHLHNAEKGIEQLSHLRINGRLAFGQRAIQVKNNELSHDITTLPAAKYPVTSWHHAVGTNMLRPRPVRAVHRPSGSYSGLRRIPARRHPRGTPSHAASPLHRLHTGLVR